LQEPAVIIDKDDLCLIVVSAKTVHLGKVVKTANNQEGIVAAKSLDNGRTYKDVEEFLTLSRVDPAKAVASGVFRFKNKEHARDHLAQFRGEE
jgi:hypothetical protein